ncbi:MAG TPA: hypothetical protein PLW39_02545, partial [Thermoflexales bacterium]|nr:hypothetical protein [Thermoflexales bacterium]
MPNSSMRLTTLEISFTDAPDFMMMTIAVSSSFSFAILPPGAKLLRSFLRTSFAKRRDATKRARSFCPALWFHIFLFLPACLTRVSRSSFAIHKEVIPVKACKHERFHCCSNFHDCMDCAQSVKGCLIGVFLSSAKLHLVGIHAFARAQVRGFLLVSAIQH